MIKKALLLLLLIFIVSCSANHPVVRTTKPDPRKSENPIVQRVKKTIYRPVTKTNTVAITKKDSPSVGNYSNATEVLEATTRVKVTTAMVLAYIENYKSELNARLVQTNRLEKSILSGFND
jgi:type IV pilus biogenesis protein CpaD/CtpE